MPPKKRVKKSRARKPVKKGLKQKQKQKQQQRVNVSVSAGGAGGGGTQFIPMPQAPAFDYMQLANLIRPANTVDIPIRAQANAEPLPMRDAEAQTLAEEFPRPGRPAPTPTKSFETQTEDFISSPSPREPAFSAEGHSSPNFMATAETIPTTKARKVRSDIGKPRGPRAGSPNPVVSGEYERMVEAQKSGTFM
jgi:hypothetical protein